MTYRSAVFYAINHTIFVDRLSLCFGVSGVALSWFKYYLSGGHQRGKVQFWDRYFLHSYSDFEHSVCSNVFKIAPQGL